MGKGGNLGFLMYLWSRKRFYCPTFYKGESGDHGAMLGRALSGYAEGAKAKKWNGSNAWFY